MVRAGSPNPPLSRTAPPYSVDGSNVVAYFGGPDADQQTVIAADVQAMFDAADKTPGEIRATVANRAKAGLDVFAEAAARLIDQTIESEEKIRGFTADANAAMEGRRPVVNKLNRGTAL